MKNSITAALVAGALAVTGSVVTATPAAAAAVVYQPAYSDDIYYVEDGQTYLLTLDDWLYLGRPTPKRTATNYVKYAWSSTVYGSTPLPNYLLVEALSPSGWARAGYPAATTVAWVPYTFLYQWGTSPELFLYSDVDQVSHKLSFGEWAASGFQPPEVFAREGFYKLGWSDAPGIQYVFERDGQPLTGEVIDFAFWASEDFPTPAAVGRLLGDHFYRYEGSDDIVYFGPTLEGHTLTLDEWLAAGAPAPELVRT
ncbi:hypothetical protein [Nakamurella deserti]|uniref:hypothetical protein n=1 Tax=Nakamurella deserti TaxID=2164074 RepID=UPI000DBE3AC8|nr:hypothetical protein [Nakamurella deserti]